MGTNKLETFKESKILGDHNNGNYSVLPETDVSDICNVGSLYHSVTQFAICVLTHRSYCATGVNRHSAPAHPHTLTARWDYR